MCVKSGSNKMDSNDDKFSRSDANLLSGRSFRFTDICHACSNHMSYERNTIFDVWFTKKCAPVLAFPNPVRD